MQSKRYTEEFRKEAARQVTKRGYQVQSELKRVGEDGDILKKAAAYFVKASG